VNEVFASWDPDEKEQAKAVDSLDGRMLLLALLVQYAHGRITCRSFLLRVGGGLPTPHPQ